MVQGKINRGRHTDHLTIWLGDTPSGLTSVHLHHPPCFLQAGCPSCHPTNSVKALKANRERYEPINLDRLALYVDMKLNCTAGGLQMSEFVTRHAVCYSCSSKIQNGLPLWCRLTQVVLEKRPLNGCSSSSSTSSSSA